MTANPLEQVGMSLDDFVREYEWQPFELLRGQRRIIPLRLAGEALVQTALIRSVLPYAENTVEWFLNAPYVVTATQTPTLIEAVRRTDVMLYTITQWHDYVGRTPDYLALPLFVVPDLAVQLLNPTHKSVDADLKTSLYLEDGVRLLWMIDVLNRTVTVHTQGSKQSTYLTADDTLDGGTVLPGFSVKVDDLFPPSPQNDKA